MSEVLTVKEFTAARIAEWTGGAVEQAGRGAAVGVSTDSRTIGREELFFALRGPRFDAHTFLGAALRKGAWGAVLERASWEREDVRKQCRPFPDRAVIAVEDTGRALGDLAAAYRSLINPKVVGITGSNGKTTTKEMAASIAARRWRVHKTAGNLNNLVGLPLTLLELEEDHEVAVLEMGMNRSGEILRLTRIARPDVGVVTNVGAVHLEHLGSVAAVSRAKEELIEALGPGAAAVLNIDDPRVAAMGREWRGRRITFGFHESADFRALEVRTGAGGCAFTLAGPEGECGIEISFIGEHNVRNALAAAAAASALGANLDDVREGLAAARPAPMRFAVEDYRDGFRIINDAYNANPESMRAALASLKLMEGFRRRAVVLGDMLELGGESAAAHHRLGVEAAISGSDRIIAVGRFSGDVARGAVDAGIESEKVSAVTSCGEAAEILKEWMCPGDLILLKGSRAMAMEEVVERLRAAAVLREAP